jgi:hypothetical protein
MYHTSGFNGYTGRYPLPGEDVPRTWATDPYERQTAAFTQRKSSTQPNVTRTNQMMYQPSLPLLPETNLPLDFMDCSGMPVDGPWGPNGSSSSHNTVDSSSSWMDFNDHSSSSYIEPFSPEHGSNLNSHASMSVPSSLQAHRYSHERQGSIAGTISTSFHGQHHSSEMSDGSPLGDTQHTNALGSTLAHESQRSPAWSSTDTRNAPRGQPRPEHYRLSRRPDRERPPKRMRSTSSDKPCHWLNFTLCSLWQRNHRGKPTSSDINLLCDAFDVSPDDLDQTWLMLYDGKHARNEATPRQLKARYIDAFCSVWRLACLDSSFPSELQIDSLSQLLSTSENEIREWFNQKLGSPDTDTPVDIEAEALAKYKNNQKDCLDCDKSEEDAITFNLPCRDDAKPFVCTTGCGKNFTDHKKWKRHEEKNWWQSLWLCTIRNCPKRKVNKHVFSRPDMFGTHLVSCHPDIEDVEGVKRRAKRTGFSGFSKDCVFKDCDVHFTSWKSRVDHLDFEFKSRKWSPRDWRDFDSESSDEQSD